ncbi:MAG: LysM domain-containing protein [Nitrospira defluvii]|nr:LysM domain-containing protein [Nitrospira defluvii]
MIDPLQALLDSALRPNPFPPTSRYYGVRTTSRLTGEGTMVVYLQRRFVPGSDRFTVVQEHRVSSGERLDHLSTTYLGDPEQYWRLCDANDAMRPDALVEHPGAVVNIALPEGATGVPGA